VCVQVVNGLLAATISAADDLLGKSASYLRQPQQQQQVPEKKPESRTFKTCCNEVEECTATGHASDQEPHAEQDFTHLATTPPLVQLPAATVPGANPAGTAASDLVLGSDHGSLPVRSDEPASRLDDCARFEAQQHHADDSADEVEDESVVAEVTDEEAVEVAVESAPCSTANTGESPHESSNTISTVKFTAQTLQGARGRAVHVHAASVSRQARDTQRLLPPQARRALSARAHQHDRVGSKRSRCPDDAAQHLQPVIWLPKEVLRPIQHVWMSTARVAPEPPSDTLLAHHTRNAEQSMPSSSGRVGSERAVAEGVARCVQHSNNRQLQLPSCQSYGS
jgi:hypothetical protein